MKLARWIRRFFRPLVAPPRTHVRGRGPVYRLCQRLWCGAVTPEEFRAAARRKWDLPDDEIEMCIAEWAQPPSCQSNHDPEYGS